MEVTDAEVVLWLAQSPWIWISWILLFSANVMAWRPHGVVLAMALGTLAWQVMLFRVALELHALFTSSGCYPPPADQIAAELRQWFQWNLLLTLLPALPLILALCRKAARKAVAEHRGSMKFLLVATLNVSILFGCAVYLLTGRLI